MRVKKQATMTWESAPDTVGVKELMAILGIGKNNAGALMNEKDFPRLPGIGVGLRADKEMARLYIQGFKVKDNPKITMEYMILTELKKINELIKKRGMITNEEIENQKQEAI